MSNVVNALKEEILRLAKREAKAQVGKAQKTASQFRREVARLKRLLAQREREVAYLRKYVQADQVQPEDAQLQGVRFSAKSVRSQRRRLGLSTAAFGKLVGVTAPAVHAWETGRARPRKAKLAALVAVRRLTKKAAMTKLVELRQ